MYSGQMRALFVLPLLAGVAFASEFEPTAKLRLAANCMLELEARETKAARSAPEESIWGYSVYNGKLYMGAGGFAPRSILTKATVILDRKSVALDVSGIGNPWLEKPYPPWFHWEDKKGLGVLRAAFSDGAEIYVVTWHLFREVSLKIEMQHLGDEEIPWLKANQREKRQLD
jgi:hypothetical protein